MKKDLDEKRLLSMIMSRDIELIKLGAISLLLLGEQVLLNFIEKYGEPRPGYHDTDTSTPVSKKIIRTSINTYGLETSGAVYIEYWSSKGLEYRKLYCGHTISVFTGTANPDMPIVDFKDIKMNR